MNRPTAALSSDLFDEEPGPGGPTLGFEFIFEAPLRHSTPKDEAYMLTSVAADVNITQLVDGNKGVHVMLPKNIFVD